MTDCRMALVFALASLVVPVGTASPSAETPLTAQREAYVAAFNAQDAARLGELYAVDATFLPFTGQVVKGAAAIVPAMVRVAGRVKLALQSVSASQSGTVGYESGTWTHVDRESGATVDGGAYMWVWRQDAAGHWTIAAQVVTRKPAGS